MDGTLLAPDGTVSDRVAAAVRAARGAGIHVVPVTGRPPQALWSLAAAAGLGPFGVCSNGAALVDLDRRQLLEVDHIPGEIAAALVQHARVAEPAIRFAVDGLDRFSHEASFFDRPVDWEEDITEVDDLTPVLFAGCIKLIARRPGLSAAELIGRLSPLLGSNVHVTTSGLDWVDIGLVGVTKATALARACARLGIEPRDVIAVGDNHNDLSMIDWAGHGVAVANAVPEVLQAAARVVPSNAGDGVAVLLEELLAAAA